MLAAALDPALFSRVLATAMIVIGVAVAVERLGPKIGGTLAGMPIVIGPGFFFLLAEREADFAAAAAAHTLLSLSATEVFLLAYCFAAVRFPPGPSVAAATFAWFASAWPLSTLPSSPLLGLLLFAAAAGLARVATGGLVRAGAARGNIGGALLLLLRGLSAAVLVAVVTIAAGRLGAAWSGILIAFPVGFAVVSVTIHQRMGGGAAIATLHAATVGVASLVAFAFALSLLAVSLGSWPAFAVALAAALAVTMLLVRYLPSA